MDWTDRDKQANGGWAAATLALIGGLAALIALNVSALELTFDGREYNGFVAVDQSSVEQLRAVCVALAFLSVFLGVLAVSLPDRRLRRARVMSWLLTLTGVALTGLALAAVSATSGDRFIAISTPPGMDPVVHVSPGLGAYLLGVAGAVVALAGLVALARRRR